MASSNTMLKMNDVSKIYVLGKQKNAKKAQRAIHKLSKKYIKFTQQGNKKEAQKAEKFLAKAQQLFADEKYEQSYQTLTGKKLKPKKGKGSVVHALNGVNLEIKAGELVAIMGPSGSGKSTLLNMLGILDQPSSGQIHIDDANVTATKGHNLPGLRSKKLGFVFQSFNLVPTLTALENVMLPLKYKGIHLRGRKRMAKEALEKVGLGDRLNHKPTELSGGQQQRVAIARSIVSNPAIILADELTGELDSKMTKEVMKLVVQLNKKGQTFIIVTHNPEVANLCKRIIYMKDGRIEKESKNSK
jgi:putative ABC transport system ATP-binding protein